MRIFTAGLPEPRVAAETMTFSASDLRPVRDAVSRRAEAAVLGYERIHDLVLAVHEITTNSVLYGGGSGALRMWDDSDAFVVEVTDVGHVSDPLVGRLPPDLEHTGGRGLWLAHQLCDLVQVRSSERGTTVRISTWR
jgi:anti-sigma regulatory factor (Ser/Thr protein kinase)